MIRSAVCVVCLKLEHHHQQLFGHATQSQVNGVCLPPVAMNKRRQRRHDNAHASNYYLRRRWHHGVLHQPAKGKDIFVTRTTDGFKPQLTITIERRKKNKENMQVVLEVKFRVDIFKA